MPGCSIFEQDLRFISISWGLNSYIFFHQRSKKQRKIVCLTLELLQLFLKRFGMTPRELVPLEQCIVILDTNVARALAHESEPSWVQIFSRMRDNGYVFALGDASITELMDQRARGSISESDAAKMIQSLQRFLYPELPILPGKRDILAMIGISPKETWNSNDVIQKSQQTWSIFCSEIYQFSLPAELLKEERDEWLRLFEDLRKFLRKLRRDLIKEHGCDRPKIRRLLELDPLVHPALDAALQSVGLDFAIFPSMTVRADLQMRLFWRQFVRSVKLKEPYNPASQKNKNDGIDFDFYYYLALPALVVSNDDGFFGKLKDICSFQKNWFFKPQDLADSWLKGNHPRPTWPVLDANQ